MKKAATFYFYDNNWNHVDTHFFAYRDSVCEAYSSADLYAVMFGYDFYELIDVENEDKK